MAGCVYIIVNKGLSGLVKVGFTFRSPFERAQELNGTGVPHPYEVARHVEVSEPRLVESIAHGRLADHFEGKEWFRCSVEVAFAAILAACEDAGVRPSEPGIRAEPSSAPGSPLVPGHALASFFPDPPMTPLNSPARDSEPAAEGPDVDESPLPPGHPLRGLL
jgi:hypothetical protein